MLTRVRALTDERIAIIDGAWGVLLQGQGLSEEDFRGERFRDHPRDVKGDPDLLNLTRPEVVSEIHRAYLEAGADITTTNTFTATSIGQRDYELQDAVRDMNLAGARLAREAADAAGGRLVAGSVGPLNVTLTLSPKVEDPGYRTVDFDQVYEAYAEQIRALRDGGVDLLLIETIFDTLNAKAAIRAAMDVAPELPRWISVTIVDRSGRTLSGQTIDAFWTSIQHAEPLIVGVNCSPSGATEIRPRSRHSPRSGRSRSAATQPGTASPLSYLRRDPRGQRAGCSGSSPRQGLSTWSAGAAAPRRVSRAIPEEVDGIAPRPMPASPEETMTSLAGLEPFRITPETGFVMV